MSDYQLVYYSANRLCGSEQEVLAQVEQILAASRRNNTLVNVTGALMFSKSYFGQVLEGPRGAIEVTFERIQQDERHGEVALLDFAPIAERSFDAWSMAFVGPTSNSSASLDAIGQMTGFDPEHLRADRLFERLRDLVRSPALEAL